MAVDDNLFADVLSEGKSLNLDESFEKTGGETPTESQTVKDTTDKPSQGGDNTPEEKTPFHKHPRWIQTQKDLKETREKLAVLEAAKTPSLELPKWYKDRFGDTDEAKANYQAITQKDGELDWIKQNIKEDLQRETQAEQTQVSDAEQYVDTQLAEMADEGLKFDRNGLLKFMVDFQAEFGAGSLLDTEGNYDFRKALAMKSRMEPEPEPDNTKKALAGQAGRTKGAPQSPGKIPVVSRNSLRKGWRDAGI